MGDLGESDDKQPSLTVATAAQASLRREAPALRVAEAVPDNLPMQLTSFIGRDEEMAELEALLGEHRLVTLTGAAGSGKTRLALQSAAHVLRSFPEGAWLVELGGVVDQAAVIEAVASTLSVSQQPGETLLDTVMSFLSNKRLLLLLDNCEHLLGGAARVAEEVLAAAPGVRLVATSREPLAIRGERIFGVPSLPLPDDGANLATLAETGAIRLFVERARAARSGFELTADNGSAVAQLCRRLDGIPLAIELAAARVRSMAPGDIASRLDQRFRLLTGASRSAINRHQTLRAAIDWSYDLLEEPERELLGRLWVCAGGFDLAAAEAVGSGGSIDELDVDDVLSRLIDKSLVVAEERGDSMRYRMLETIRAYAAERLEDAEQIEAVRRRHAAHYATFATDASVGLKGPAEVAWLHRVEDELDNLRAVVAWSLDSDDPSPAVTVVHALALTGLRIEGVVGAWAAAVAASSAASADVRYPAAVAFHSWITQREGRSDAAERLAQEAASLIADEDYAPAVVCRVLASTTGVDGFCGRNPLDQAQRWVHAARACDDRYDEALAHSMVAVGQILGGQPVASATATADRGLALARSSGSPTAVAYTSFTASLYRISDDPARAAILLDESVRSADAAENSFAPVTVAGLRAALLSKAGDHQAAAHAFQDYAERAMRSGHRTNQALALCAVGGSLAALGRDEAASTVIGWATSVAGVAIEHSTAVLNLHADAGAAMASLPSRLGAERHAELAAIGAAMSDDEILHYAAGHLGVAIHPSEATPATESEPPGTNEFRRDGEVWLVAYDGQVCRLKDSKGMQYIAALLSQSGREVHVADLAGASIADTAGTGPALDARAAAAYRNRIHELQSEIDEAEEWSDPERVARARAEMDALTAELTSAYGMGGRARTGPDPAERVRKAVTNRIRDALDRIDAEHPALGRHLRNAVRTGTFCSYQPERPTTWSL